MALAGQHFFKVPYLVEGIVAPPRQINGLVYHIKFDKKRWKVKIYINGLYFGLEGGVCHIYFS